MSRADRRVIEFARFILAGLLNTGLTYGLYLAVLRVTNYMVAYTASYLVGILISYFLNSFFVFNTVPSRRTALRFPFIYIVQYIAGSVLLWFLVRMLGIGEKVAMLIVIAANAVLTFILMKRLFKAKWP